MAEPQAADGGQLEDEPQSLRGHEARPEARLLAERQGLRRRRGRRPGAVHRHPLGADPGARATSCAIKYGAQDVSEHPSGAYTGEISGPMLAKLGLPVRRGRPLRAPPVPRRDRRAGRGQGEAALQAGITPIVCVGEHLEVRKAGAHVEHCVAQIDGSLAGLTAEQVQARHRLRAGLGDRHRRGRDPGGRPGGVRARSAVRAGRALRRRAWPTNVRILYGGSVKGANVAEIMAQEDIDGALVGGASLDAADFTRIVRFRDSAVAAG